MTHAETLSFTTETSQLLKLMIHSLYSNREIFLRELVSNASDALDKLRFEGYSDGTLLDGGGELRIEIECDPAAHTVTVRDNGIGMSREEVIANIGTIARSGTAEFVKALQDSQTQDARLIGQFVDVRIMGADEHDLAPLGERFAAEYPQALVASLRRVREGSGSGPRP